MNSLLDRLSERVRPYVLPAVRVVLGWHLAYLGVWALTSEWTFSWYGRLHGAHWILGGFFRALADSPLLPAVDAVFAWGLLLAGLLLMVGRLVAPAAFFGVFYLAFMYVVNPPHFGHTGESHYLYVDRNVVEVLMLSVVMFARRKGEVAE